MGGESICTYLNLAGAEIEFTVDVYFVKYALEPLVDSYDYIIIDAPPSLGFFTVNALICCNGVIVPLQCERLAQKALYNLLDIMTKLRRRNSNLMLAGIALTFYDRRVKISKQIEEETREEFDDLVFQTQIPRHVTIMDASANSMAVAEHDPKSAGAIAYHALAQEVLNG